MHRGPARQSFADRLWSKVAVRRFPNGLPDYGPASLPAGHSGRYCWDWLSPSTTGTQRVTGRLRLPGEAAGHISASRAALLVFLGVPDAELAAAHQRNRHLDGAHSCDRPQCCNPTHLSWQTHQENIRDYITKYGGICRAKTDQPTA